MDRFLAYLFYRIRFFGAALAVRQIAAQQLREANATHARRLEEFIRQMNSPPQTPPAFRYSPQISEQHHIVNILIFLTLVTIDLYLASQFQLIDYEETQHNFLYTY
jgi:hypothetical protein